ncbi:arrestin domain-containing protein 3-like [Plakobranchus ocellatus]|uniref:Arrestin domain-containing protein 3-like n=1 Tax=Plakobranchus ocellatus TaxID=259542 RepID=A0AAV3YA82_9GAST|nr:arrestin domain-containing protein 3-like [Plakobranchus ocellatus]
MRVELFEVHFNNSNSIYIGGQTVSGKVVVKLSKATWIDSIDIKFTGRAKSKWDVSNGDSSKQYKATEVYIDSEHHLYRCRGENDLQPAGLHMYPFDFTLPPDVPSSFEGRRGFVRYLCVVTLDRGWKGVLQIEQDLTVIRHLDLNQVHNAGLPQNLEREEVYEGCCCDSGDVSAYLQLPKSGYVPGEPLNYNLVVYNKATSSICGLVMNLIQTVRYTGYSDSLFSSGNPKYHDKVNSWTLMQADDEIAPGKTATYSTHCVIPAVAPSLLEGCNIIDINYELHVEVPVGWRTIQMCCAMFIGTIPLRQTRTTSTAPTIEEPVADSGLPPVSRHNFDLPPSYEECVFGRMESQELEPGEDVDDDDDDVSAARGAAGSSSATASRRSRLHRLPSYPYYSFESPSNSTAALATPVTTAHSVAGHTNSSATTSTALSSNSYPDPPPLPQGDHQGYMPLPIMEQPTYTSLPPPPSYESLGLNG